jgi:plasmid stability protein
MTTLTVRNVPTEVRNALAAKAALAGQSMQEYTLAALSELARRIDQREVLSQLRAQQKAFPAATRESLLADLDQDRR